MLLPGYDAAAGLVSSQNEYFGYLDVGGSLGGIEGNVGYVIAREGFDALIDFLGPFGIAMEADAAEVGLYEARFEVGHADWGGGQVDAETV